MREENDEVRKGTTHAVETEASKGQADNDVGRRSLPPTYRNDAGRVYASRATAEMERKEQHLVQTGCGTAPCNLRSEARQYARKAICFPLLAVGGAEYIVP